MSGNIFLRLPTYSVESLLYQPISVSSCYLYYQPAGRRHVCYMYCLGQTVLEFEVTKWAVQPPSKSCTATAEDTTVTTFFSFYLRYLCRADPMTVFSGPPGASIKKNSRSVVALVDGCTSRLLALTLGMTARTTLLKTSLYFSLNHNTDFSAMCWSAAKDCPVSSVFNGDRFCWTLESPRLANVVPLIVDRNFIL